MNTFEKAYGMFMENHIQQRHGERKGRLERNTHHAEKLFLKNVWWPLKGDLNYLHPEYEVKDWRGRSYFGDFAYLTDVVRIIFEIKGFGPHVAEMDRKQYCNELNREVFLQAMGFRVVSFAYDDVSQRPAHCITLLRMFFSRFEPASSPVGRAVLAEKEIIRLAAQLARPIRPKDIAVHFAINHRTAV